MRGQGREDGVGSDPSPLTPDPCFFDTHAHLTDPAFGADRSEVIERAREAGVPFIVEIADEPKDWDAAIALSRANPGRVFCSLGVHPYYASQLNEKLLLNLESKLSLPEVVAVGEIGLDYAKSPEPKDVQRKAFETLLAKCLEWDKPAVVHCREAYSDLRTVLSRACPKPPSARRYWGVVHCFSGTAEDALACASAGFALGVDGPVTYPKNDGLRAAFKAVGVGALVLETDSPYLPPQSCRGKRNEPVKTVEIAGKLADVLGLSLEEVARETTKNARDLYRLARD